MLSAAGRVRSQSADPAAFWAQTPSILSPSCLGESKIRRSSTHSTSQPKARPFLPATTNDLAPNASGAAQAPRWRICRSACEKRRSPLKDRALDRKGTGTIGKLSRAARVCSNLEPRDEANRKIIHISLNLVKERFARVTKTAEASIHGRLRAISGCIRTLPSAPLVSP